MWIWADLTSVDEGEQERMREELLTARDVFGFKFPDEEAVFSYLSEENVDLGDVQAEVSAIEIGKLWDLRYELTYEHWSDRADAWTGGEQKDLLRYLYGVADRNQARVLDELKTQLGKAFAEDESGELCYIDRTSSGGDILCLKRRDD
jgi:hypothetical protein